MQLGFARSIDPIISQDITITRVAITTEKDAEDKKTEMGRKNIVPYALYRAEGYISANLAKKSPDSQKTTWNFSGRQSSICSKSIILQRGENGSQRTDCI